MKATGIVRRMDRLGRLSIPVELRRVLKLGDCSSVEFWREGDTLIIKKHDAAGDLEQILENTEENIRLQDAMSPVTVGKLLTKVEEMKKIVAAGGGK